MLLPTHTTINILTSLDRTLLEVPFLNLMSILNQRAGRVNIRVGGNTQEEATLVDSLPDGRLLQKDQASQANPVSRDNQLAIFRANYLYYPKTETPALLYTPDVFYLLANISALVNVKWYLGELCVPRKLNFFDESTSKVYR
jgi:hypothetical protein